MKLKHLVEPLTADLKAVSAHHKFTPATLADMWKLLGVVSHNRAYNDSHPSYQACPEFRALPCDGRDYCFYYADGATDAHVATLLNHILKNWNL